MLVQCDGTTVHDLGVLMNSARLNSFGLYLQVLQISRKDVVPFK